MATPRRSFRQPHAPAGPALKPLPLLAPATAAAPLPGQPSMSRIHARTHLMSFPLVASNMSGVTSVALLSPSFTHCTRNLSLQSAAAEQGPAAATAATAPGACEQQQGQLGAGRVASATWRRVQQRLAVGLAAGPLEQQQEEESQATALAAEAMVARAGASTHVSEPAKAVLGHLPCVP